MRYVAFGPRAGTVTPEECDVLATAAREHAAMLCDHFQWNDLSTENGMREMIGACSLPWGQKCNEGGGLFRLSVIVSRKDAND